jgi:hypothetical protein
MAKKYEVSFTVETDDYDSLDIEDMFGDAMSAVDIDFSKVSPLRVREMPEDLYSEMAVIFEKPRDVIKSKLFYFLYSNVLKDPNVPLRDQCIEYLKSVYGESKNAS